MAEFFTPEKDKLGLRTPSEWRSDLPSAFLIGDSISCGYTETVQEVLRDEINVRRAPDNCGDTRRGLQCVDDWLGDGKWDIIHFNWGLHDLCYRHPEAKVYGNRDKEKGVLSVPLEEYSCNLEKLVERLKNCTSNLIWATTTYVPAGEAGRFQGDDIKYNEAAAVIMAEHGIRINDLHALTSAFDAGLFSGPGDVHYTDEGSRILGKQVAAAIRGLASDSGLRSS